VSTFAHNGQNIPDAQRIDDIETKILLRVVFTAADPWSLRRSDWLHRDRRSLCHGLADATAPAAPRDAAGLSRIITGRYPLSLAHWRTPDDPDRRCLQPSARDRGTDFGGFVPLHAGGEETKREQKAV
jgi:hypothetical protein